MTSKSTFFAFNLLLALTTAACGGDPHVPPPATNAGPPEVVWADSLGAAFAPRLHASPDGLVLTAKLEGPAPTLDGRTIEGDGFLVAALDTAGHVLWSQVVGDSTSSFAAGANDAGVVGVVVTRDGEPDTGPTAAACGQPPAAVGAIAVVRLASDRPCGEASPLAADAEELGDPRFAGVLPSGEIAFATYHLSLDAPTGEVVLVDEQGEIEWRRTFSGEATSFAVRATDGAIAVARDDADGGSVIRYSAKGAVVGDFHQRGWLVSTMAFGADGTLVVAGLGGDDAVVGLDEQQSRAWGFDVSEDIVDPLALIAAPDGDLLIAVEASRGDDVFGQGSQSEDNTSTVVWRMSASGEDPVPVVSSAFVESGVVSPDGTLALTAGYTDTVTVGDTTFVGTDFGEGLEGSFVAGFALDTTGAN